MKNKKWYLIIVAIVLVLGGVFFVISKSGTDNMDGKYYFYYDDDNTYEESKTMEINGDDVHFISYSSDGNNEESTAKLNKKSKEINGGINSSYSYDKAVFSFNNVKYVKEGSDTFKSIKE